MNQQTTIGWNLDAERELWAAICAPNRWISSSTPSSQGCLGPDLQSVQQTTHVNGAGNVSLENRRPSTLTALQLSGQRTAAHGETHPDSLWWFTRLAFGTEWYFRGGYTPGPDAKQRWLTDRVHKPYLRWLQAQILEWKASRRRGDNKRWYVSVMIARDCGKTVTTTKASSLWEQLDDPDESIIIGSVTHPLAIDILNTIKLIMSGKVKYSWFGWLYGNWRNPDREWAKTACHHGYRVTTSLSEPSFDTTAVGIGMTGYHPDKAWWDDPLSLNKIREEGNFVEAAQTAFNATYPAVKKNGWIGMVLTPYLDDDIRGRHLREEGILSWDGIPPPDERLFEKVPMGKGIWRVYFFQVKDELTNKSNIPEIFTDEEIERWEKFDPEDFACQGQCNPGAATSAPLLDWQVRDCYLDYALLRNDLPVEYATIHIDTAFKSKENIGKNDESAIVVYLHDSRPNGLMYLHTDLLRCSNRWRSDEFDDELIKVMNILRRQGYRVRWLTDEKEPGGKEGSYKEHLIAMLRGAGFGNIMPRIHQFNRQGVNKRSRIRKAAGYWADGYVRILLHKTGQDWSVPPIVRQLVNQLVRVDIVGHDDLADAASDAFSPPVWRRPSYDTMTGDADQGMPVIQPGDSDLKAMSRKLTDEEVKAMMDGAEFAEMLGPGHGPDIIEEGYRYGA